MSVKHLYDSTEGLVLKSLRGTVSLNPSLSLDAASKSVYLHAKSPHKRVAVIAGGGAGHEPAHAGYIGSGMLTACVAGEVFASPTAKQILATIKLAAFSGLDSTSTPRDVLIIINNYTGDRLNFGLAIEKARSEYPNVNINSVIVADDISLLSQTPTTLVGPRGLAGNILVCKLLGALAETGAALDLVKAFGDSVVDNLRSVGVGLDPCHIPGRAPEGSARLSVNDYELGLGLHNEAGVAKRKLRGADEMLEAMMVDLLDVTRDWKMNETALFVNNLGGMSQLEMGAAVYDILSLLGTKGIPRPKRIYCSSYMTSLNAPGFSVSLLNIAGIHADTQALTKTNCYALLDASTTALAWVSAGTWQHDNLSLPATPTNATPASSGNISIRQGHGVGSQPQHMLPLMTKNAIRGACIRVLEIQHEITQYDTLVGDGDCGETFAAGANAVLKALEDGTLDVKGVSLAFLVRYIADILEDVMGGTIGALFGIFLNALSSTVADEDTDLAQTLSPKSISTLFRGIQAAISSLELYTPARVGDRTIMDALYPFGSVLRVHGNVDSQPLFAEAVQAARRGAEGTRGMQARLGRAAYLNVRQEEMPPDPGAWGVCAVLEGLMRGLEETK